MNPTTIPGLLNTYHGKVRDVYYIENELLVMIASDRISAFDVILPRPIPYKGAVLNLLSAFFLKQTKSIAPNWLNDVPNPYLSVGAACQQIPVEVIVRGFIAGSMWRAYENGVRDFCGNILPDGLKRNQKLEFPIITPTTKAAEGHDEDTTEAEIIKNGILTIESWELIKKYAFGLYQFGQEYAAKKNLILVDTKFEFGQTQDGEILLIDEILTPDSSRYFILDAYQSNFENGQEPEQLSKEFVRQWLIENNFMGRVGDMMPEMSDSKVEEISSRYINLYEQLTGLKFEKNNAIWNEEEIHSIVSKYLND
jgi:phosphoribosylaminoimidazole-succinocarboxamide synthase